MANGNVLVVEDEESIRRLLIDFLKEHSALAVDGARDGVDALHHVSTKKYNVVVLDVMMPYMTGIDFLDSLQAHTSDPSVKHLDELPAVIVITSAAPEQVPEEMLRSRFPNIVRGVLRKPLRAEELARCVTELISGRA